MCKGKAEITIEEAAQKMRKNPQYVRLGLQQERLPFGSAVQNSNGRWSYNIVPMKFNEYMGIK